jgi:membrane-associated phospholipid phosphatase
VKSLHPPRALWLVLAWIVLIVAGLALHALSTLISSQDLALVRDLAGQRTGLLTALAHVFSLLGRSYVLVPCAIVIAVGALRLGRPLYGMVMIVRVKLLAAFLTVVIIAGVAVSWVYLGVHYPTDVGAGIVLGGSWSLTTATVMLRGRVDREPA